nr:Hsp70 family protein [Spirochaeta sp.]
MKTENIGIKVADGTIFPVIEEGFSGQKKLILTTVRDNQTAVQIDLYKGGGEKAEQGNYVATLVIENIPASPKGNPEVEVVLGVDDSGNLNARASDIITGEQQSLSVSLESLSSQGSYDSPEFALDEELPESQGSESVNDFEQELLTGETYPIIDSDRRREYIERKKRNPLLLIGFVVLCLFLIAILAFFIYKGLQGTGVPALQGGTVSELPVGNNGEQATEVPPPAEKKTETTEEKVVEQSTPARPGLSY